MGENEVVPRVQKILENHLKSKRKTHLSSNDLHSTTFDSVILPVMCLFTMEEDSPGDWGLGGTTASLFGEDGRERVISELRWNSFLPTVDHQKHITTDTQTLYQLFSFNHSFMFSHSVADFSPF